MSTSPGSHRGDSKVESGRYLCMNSLVAYDPPMRNEPKSGEIKLKNS
jgi:hypothetical protein